MAMAMAVAVAVAVAVAMTGAVAALSGESLNVM